MIPRHQPTVLAVCLPPLAERWLDVPGVRLFVASSGAEAMESLRRLRFDLLLVPNRDLPDMPRWVLPNVAKGLEPRQKWVLVAEELKVADEVRARTLGVSAVVGVVGAGPVIHELLGLSSPAWGGPGEKIELTTNG